MKIETTSTICTQELEMTIYKSRFKPSKFTREEILRKGKILSFEESPSDMINRVVGALYTIEQRLSTEGKAKKFATFVGDSLDAGKIIFSTPIMTNAGRSEFHRPLSACVVPDINLNGDVSLIKKVVDTYHEEGMGTGFNLDDVQDPAQTLLMLNEIALEGSAGGLEDRPVGNMAICDVYHPRIVDFIVSKLLRRGTLWKFNISVNTPSSFWEAVTKDQKITLRNGMSIYAKELLDMMSEAAHVCADPGLIFMDRINADNPIRSHGDYLSVAPCGEVGLLPGETCQFGYLNVAEFYRDGEFILDDFVATVHLMTRALDNCLEISTELYALEVSRRVMRARRKIGIGICGLADLFIKMNLPYSSPEARKIARDTVALMNYESKMASYELAKERGSFTAMNDTAGCRYNERPGFLESKYGNLDTLWVSGSDWLNLDATIRESRLMRHCSTVALPPTGRSSLIISASTGVEPLFNLKDNSGEYLPVVLDCFDRNGVSPDSFSGSGGAKLKSILKTSTEILSMDHLMMVAALQPVVDESISKTINLPSQASVSDVRDIYVRSHSMKLKGVTMYRDGSSLFQPKKL